MPTIKIEPMDWDETLAVAIMWHQDGVECGKAGYIDLGLLKTASAPNFYKDDAVVEVVKKMINDLLDIYVEARSNAKSNINRTPIQKEQ